MTLGIDCLHKGAQAKWDAEEIDNEAPEASIHGVLVWPLGLKRAQWSLGLGRGAAE